MDAERNTAKAPAKRTGGRLKRLVPLGLVLAAATLVGVVALLPTHVPAPPSSAIPPVDVTIERVQALPKMPDTFDLTAVVEPERVVRVSAEVPGRIEQLGRRQDDVTWHSQVLSKGTPIEEGKPISKGDPIVELNKDLMRARYDQAQAQYDYDDREYRRILDLYERGATSKTELDDARTKRGVSKAALDEATFTLERCTIVAPIAGILNSLLVEVGEYVSSGDPVAEIVAIERVKVVVDIPERDVPFLKVGDTADILVRGPAGPPIHGKLTYLSAVADEGTRTTRLEITVDNRDSRLYSGQIVRARLTRRVLENVIMIPLGAVIPLERGRVVYIVNDAHAERREVTLGMIKGRHVRILDGLHPGEQLIVAGHRYVGPGQPVTVVEEQLAGMQPAARRAGGKRSSGKGQDRP